MPPLPPRPPRPFKQRRRAVVLLSGGLDSATTLAIAQFMGFHCHCLMIDYGQRHKREIRAAEKISKRAGCSFTKIRIRFPWGGSALTDRKIRVPKSRSFQSIRHGIPSTYVPARNTIFLGLALGCAEATGASRVFIGANFLDASGYPDCRPEYYRAFGQVIRRGTKSGVEGAGIRIATPLIRKTKAQIIRLGQRLKVPYELTWSCYQGGSRPCGRCDSCLLRANGFREAGLEDPAQSPRSK